MKVPGYFRTLQLSILKLQVQLRYIFMFPFEFNTTRFNLDEVLNKNLKSIYKW